MKNETEYRKVFSQVKVSDQIKMEVLNMKKQEFRKNSVGFRRLVVLTAAVLVFMALAVTAFASEEVSGWAKTFFLAFAGELNQKQADYLAEMEQPILDSQTVNDWTVELKSAISDGNVGFVVVDFKAPEGMDVWKYGFENTMDHLKKSPVILPEGVSQFMGWGFHWLEDGDGLANTKRMVWLLDPDEKQSKVDTFGPDVEYGIYLENIVDTSIESSDGEIFGDVIVEGQWNFEFTFTEAGSESRELLKAPVEVTGYFDKEAVKEWVFVEAPVQLTSVELRSLTVTVFYEATGDIPGFFHLAEDGETAVNPKVFMKDGSYIELMSIGANSFGYQTLIAAAPIVIENADHILFADGTVIPVS